MAGEGEEENCSLFCSSCSDLTKYICIDCAVPICNKCSVFEKDEDIEGWQAGKSVGRCSTCDKLEPKPKRYKLDRCIGLCISLIRLITSADM